MAVARVFGSLSLVVCNCARASRIACRGLNDSIGEKQKCLTSACVYRYALGLDFVFATARRAGSGVRRFHTRVGAFRIYHEKRMRNMKRNRIADAQYRYRDERKMQGLRRLSREFRRRWHTGLKLRRRQNRRAPQFRSTASPRRWRICERKLFRCCRPSSAWRALQATRSTRPPTRRT